MGLKERQERDREAVSRAILDAARDLFVAEGYQNVSMRKIAERIEYSPAAIYGYFPSKDDIFFALAEEGFRLLIGQTSLERPPPGPTSILLDCIRQALMRVYEFSKSHPEYFALMFLDRSVPRISKGLAAVRFPARDAAADGRADSESDRCRGGSPPDPGRTCCSGSCSPRSTASRSCGYAIASPLARTRMPSPSMRSKP